MTRPTSYFCIKTESAEKAGLNAQGSIAYAVLRDVDNHDAYICLLGNDTHPLCIVTFTYSLLKNRCNLVRPGWSFR